MAAAGSWIWPRRCSRRWRALALGVAATGALAEASGAAGWPESDRVTSLPGLPDYVDVGVQYAGYVPVNGPHGPPGLAEKEELFYWFVGRRDMDPETQPTVLWTSGGPGASSFWGFFFENGPYAITRRGATPEGAGLDAQLALEPRSNAWSDHANYLIFEHPLGVTLSFPSDADDLPGNVTVGIAGLVQALLHLVDRHPFIGRNPLLLAGESYAGTYLPLLAAELVKINREKGRRVVDLMGVVLVSPWVSPHLQMDSVVDYAAEHGLISEDKKRELVQTYSWEKGNMDKMKDAVQNISGLYMLNIAKEGDPDVSPLLQYLNRVDVRDAIHAKQGPLVTEATSTPITNLYNGCLNLNVEDQVNFLLEEVRLQVIVVSGLNDATDCNFLGSGRWIHRLNGPRAELFKAARPWQWRQPQAQGVLGFIQDAGDRGLSWVKVLNAGHMAPQDQPLLINLLVNMTGVRHLGTAQTGWRVAPGGFLAEPATAFRTLVE